MAELTTRLRSPELMDDPSLPAAQHRAALAGLARINALAMTNRAMVSELIAEAGRLGRSASSPLRILDIATGGGDLPVAIALQATAAGLNLRVFACDISPVALRHAAALARSAGVEVSWFSHDIVAADLADQFDIITCGLFLHHLDHSQIVTVLGRMARAATSMLLIQDLRRSSLGMLLARVVPRLLTRSPVVHTDAVLSVQGALTIAELAGLADEAGLGEAVISPLFPQRMRLCYRPTRTESRRSAGQQDRPLHAAAAGGPG